MSAKVFHPISITTILSSSSSAVSLVRQSSPLQHASDDTATCFRRRGTCFRRRATCFRHARRCLNAWRNRSAENMYGYAAEEAFGQDVIELIVDSKDFALIDDTVVKIL
ncbi:uncharacterized protein DS421_7g210590 [Arachis hypogaea]|nr:uncharacterized protein DS421_7g210590 [Arachis hypogaea]